MTKYSIQVKYTEKELYRIFKDVKEYGRTIFQYPDCHKQQSIARTIGVRVAPLVEQNLIVPPLSSTNKHRMTGIQLPIGVEITEKKLPNGSRFYFQRKK